MQDITKRRRARELTIQVLFQKEFVPDVSIKISLDYFQSQLDIPSESIQYAEFLLEGVEKHKAEIDQKIAAVSHNWKLSRMSAVDLNILRMGVFELLYNNDETPAPVIMDEAVEIAKKYGRSESHSFVNGILDEIFKGK
jgi:transcription antitermination protein NusB